METTTTVLPRNARTQQPLKLRLIAVTAMIPILVLALFVFNPKHRIYTRSLNETMWRIRSIDLAAFEYARNHNGNLPPAEHWEETLGVSDIAVVPTYFWEPTLRFAMNKEVAGKNIKSLYDPSHTVLFFESTLQTRDATADMTTMPPCTFRGGYVTFVAFVDGHQEDISCEGRQAVIQRSKQP